MSRGKGGTVTDTRHKKRVKAGKPFLVFGDGESTACKPIGEADLAGYLCDCLERLSRPVDPPLELVDYLRREKIIGYSSSRIADWSPAECG